jgi:hypothetical protein
MAAAQRSSAAPALEKPKERPSALRSIIAGSTAGAVEIGMFVFFFGLVMSDEERGGGVKYLALIYWRSRGFRGEHMRTDEKLWLIDWFSSSHHVSCRMYVSPFAYRAPQSAVLLSIDLKEERGRIL